jgi:UPF0271 protein
MLDIGFSSSKRFVPNGTHIACQRYTKLSKPILPEEKMREVDLNSDLGESFGPYRIGDDEAMLGLITSANVACGFHGGDPLVMHRTATRALEGSVDLGAHPGFNDLWGFGRRKIVGDSPADIEKMLIYQIAALQGMARAVGHRVTHVKLHGALATLAFEDRGLADALARAMRALDRDLILVSAPHNEIEWAARSAGIRVACEVFADRLYGDNGLLLPRSEPGAVIHDPVVAAAQALRMVDEQAIWTVGGRKVALPVHTICVHGDNPQGVAIATAVRAALEGAGVRLRPISELNL